MSVSIPSRDSFRFLRTFQIVTQSGAICLHPFQGFLPISTRAPDCFGWELWRLHPFQGFLPISTIVKPFGCSHKRGVSIPSRDSFRFLPETWAAVQENIDVSIPSRDSFRFLRHSKRGSKISILKSPSLPGIPSDFYLPPRNACLFNTLTPPFRQPRPFRLLCAP
jgi:hypothetical protein